MDFLKNKLDNKEQFVQALANATHLGFSYYIQQATFKWTENARMSGIGNTVEGWTNYDWWVAREWLRIDRKIYRTTDTLQIVNRLNPLAFAHVSSDDPKMVAYTPDRAFGAQDRQLRLTCSKLLSKLFPVFTDFYIAALAADHEAEVNGVIEFVTGTGIAEAYASPGAPHSCMAPKPVFRGVMPALAYDMPNIKMAVLRSGDKVTARCMVYENGDDKRYIRNYGDQKLARRLERAGYSLGGWTGVEFKPVRILQQPDSDVDAVDPNPIDPEVVDNYLLTVPYLDANGSSGSGYGSHMYLLGGRLYTFGSAAEQVAIQRLVSDSRIIGPLLERGEIFRTSIFPDSNGRARFTNIPASAVEFTCCLTGKKYNKLRDTQCLVWVNGEFGYTGDVELVASMLRVYATDADQAPAGTSTYYVMPDTPTFVSSGYTFRDTEANRLSTGWRKLDPAYYPAEESAEWVWGLQPTQGVYGIRRADAVWLVGEDGEMHKVHQSVIQKKVHVKLHGTHNGLDGFAVASKVYRTAHGRKVHPKFNDVARTFDGYELPRNVDRGFSAYYGKEVWYFAKGTTPAVRQAQYEQHVTAALDATLDTASNLAVAVQAVLEKSMYCTQNAILTASMPALERLGRVVRVTDVHKATLDELEVLAKHWLPQSTMDCELLFKRLLLKISEAKAHDYNNTVPASDTVATATAVSEANPELDVTEVQIQPAETCHV